MEKENINDCPEVKDDMVYVSGFSFGDVEKDLNEDAPTFDEDDFSSDEYVKNDEMDDPENKKRFLKSLSPEYKAQLVYASMCNNQELIKSGAFKPLFGHEKRIYLRKLTREAKKGKLDKYFG